MKQSNTDLENLVEQFDNFLKEPKNFDKASITILGDLVGRGYDTNFNIKQIFDQDKNTTSQKG